MSGDHHKGKEKGILVKYNRTGHVFEKRGSEKREKKREHLKGCRICVTAKKQRCFFMPEQRFCLRTKIKST